MNRKGVKHGGRCGLRRNWKLISRSRNWRFRIELSRCINSRGGRFISRINKNCSENTEKNKSSNKKLKTGSHS